MASRKFREEHEERQKRAAAAASSSATTTTVNPVLEMGLHQANMMQQGGNEHYGAAAGNVHAHQNGSSMKVERKLFKIIIIV